jgi:integrase
MPDFVAKRLGKSTGNVRRGKQSARNIERMEWSLFDGRGRRKYLVPLERRAFLQAALGVRGKVASFCAVLVFTGGRISEVLALTPERIDDGNCAINLETLKRRKRGITRAIPVPRKLLYFLEAVHHYREAQGDSDKMGARLWPWSRTTAWRRVKDVMRLARVPDHLSKPKAVRHAFGAAGTIGKITLSMIQHWLGHADIRTTSIYTTVIGSDARKLAQKTWKGLQERL